MTQFLKFSVFTLKYGKKLSEVVGKQEFLLNMCVLLYFGENVLHYLYDSD
jgi:hypothetical protein